MGVRAAVVVTGTEVLTGRVADRNGPWLAQALQDVNVDIAQTVVVGDRPDDLRDALRYLADAGVALIITSGGLGPTADDLTADVVAEVQGRELHVDTALQASIEEILARLSAGRGWRTDPAATAEAVRKQSRVPDGGSVLSPVGTAPGLVIPVADGRSGPPVLVLPGPPSELQGMWPQALADPIVAAALGEREQLQHATLLLWGTPESELAATLRDYGAELDGLEITTCLRDGELEIVTRYPQRLAQRYQAFADALVRDYPDTAYSPDGRSVDDLVATELLRRNLTIATAESCTGGLLAGRLTDRPGSSAYLLGSVVTYSNEAKSALAYVPAQLIAEVGAVSAEVAQAMAVGACRRVGADVGVGITGIAGPGGGSADKPVGLVHLCAVLHDEVAGDTVRPQRVMISGGRRHVRERTVVYAMHLVRELLQSDLAAS